MSKIFKVYHRECEIENKIYHITTKYDFNFNPLEIIIKEKKTKKIVYKVICYKGKIETKVYSKLIEDSILNEKIII